MKIWPPDNPADISSFTAYNSRTCQSTSVCSSQDTIITESKTLSLSPLNISYTPHMIKDIMRGTSGFPEELEVEEEDAHIEEEDDPPVWPSQHLTQVYHLLNPLFLLLPNTCFLSPSTSLSDR